MAAVEQAQLHHFERRDIRNELRAGVLPRRPRAGEAILDDPLAERFRRDGSFVAHAEQPFGFG